MKITLKEPDGPYSCDIDPGVMSVNITEAFLGVGFTTEDGQRLSVCMRDDGFEVKFNDDKWVEFKPGSTNAPSS